MSLRKLAFVFFMLFPFLLVFSVLGWRKIIEYRYDNQIYISADAEKRPVAIVYGAAVYRGNRLSSILRDRMDTAIELYEAGIVDEILVSGDRQGVHYDEPGVMADYAIARGIPNNHIRVDGEGKRTYATCYRARNTFDYSEAILVTQGFHLPRALFTCNQLGVNSIGVEADRRMYRGENWYNIRETAATARALLDVILAKEPVLSFATALQD